MQKLFLHILEIFLLSFAVILFEISLSRYFSYILSYHFVFIIIAFSLLGLAIGQILFARYTDIIKANLFLYHILVGLIYIACVVILFYLPGLDIFSTGSLGLLLFIAFSILPFISFGILFGYIFQSNSFNSGLIYAFDLFGGAAAAFLAIYLMNNLNLVNVFALIFLAILAAILLNGFSLRRGWIIIVPSTCLIIIISSFLILKNYDLDFQIVKSPDKDLVRIENNPSIRTEKIESRWSSFGKTDLVKITDPDGETYESMFIDGAAGTKVVDISKLEKDTGLQRHTLMHFIASFPFNFLNDNEKDSALIIGPGGGVDIAAAYFGKTKFIKAVEVNPSFVELMNKYNPSTFADKNNIEVVVKEGRNFVKTTDDKFDLIFLTIPITKGSRSSDYINLTENYLFTVEALNDYMKLLTDEGRIAFTVHNEEEVFKILSNFLAFKENEGTSQSEALKNVYVISNGMMPLIVIKKTPFQKSEILPRHELAHKMNYDNDVLFFPYIEQIRIDTVLDNGNGYSWMMFNQLIVDISQGKYNMHQFSRDASMNFHPVFDNSPFFFNYELGIPQNTILLLFIFIVILILLFPAFHKTWFVTFENNEVIKNRNKLFNYFALLVLLINIADILIQAYLFQKLNLNLSSPAKSFSLLLFSLLLGTGLGSLLTVFVKHSFKVLGISLISIVAITLIEIVFILPVAVGIDSEITLFFIILLPSVLIGLPFPIILYKVAENMSTNGVAILLGVSGIGFFIGSIIIIIAATIWGYNLLIIFALLIYLISIFLVMFQNKLNFMAGEIIIKNTSNFEKKLI